MTWGHHMIKMNDQIKKIGTAIFFDESDSILRFPNSVVHVLSTSKNGDVWFAISKPYTDASGLEKLFPVRLQFYNKDCDYYLTGDGIASVVADVNEMPDEQARYIFQTDKERMILCVSIKQMEYFTRRKKEQTVSGIVLSKIIPSFYTHLYKNITNRNWSLFPSFRIHSLSSVFSLPYLLRYNNKN